ncbi:MAG: hypothetical protein SWK90_07575 [Chloroflexota bacterium]|nr:hypothetical protein [Chloroflexota bacterium]
MCVQHGVAVGDPLPEGNLYGDAMVTDAERPGFPEKRETRFFAKNLVSDLLWLFFLALTVRLIVAVIIRRPGYMDTAYYAAGAVRLAQGDGLSEPFLWHYLDDPVGLPHPGFLYWMPLPSLLAAPFAALFSNLQSPISNLHYLPGSFFALQIPFVFLAALFPLVGYIVAWQTMGVRRHAWVAGLLTLFSGLFFPYWTLPETFTPFALFGSLALWLAGNWRLDIGNWKLETGRWLLVGLLVGLAHLTRADGILLLPVVILALLARPLSCTTYHARRFVICHLSFVIVHCSLVVLGYLLTMGPWFLRNLSVIGLPLSPAGTKTLWLRTYDDLFCYGCDLSLRSYLAWGWLEIARSKLWATGVNLERFLAEDCLIFLLPLVIVGLYRLHRRLPFTLSIVYLCLVYLAHSLAFTFPGPRGGFFHASGLALPFLFAATMEGLDATVGWASRRRRWNLRQAQTVFATATVVAAVALSGYAMAGKLPAWSQDADQAYQEVGAWLDAHGVPESTIIMVGNPPGFWYHVRRPAVVVPNAGVDVLLQVANRYDVGYMLLDWNRPVPLVELYAGETTHPLLQPVAVWGEGSERVVLFRVETMWSGSAYPE